MATTKYVDINGLSRFRTKLKQETLPTSESITLSTSGWSLNSTTSYYEYSVSKSGVTASTQVNIYLDIDNQKKFTGTAYTLSSSGSYKIITDKLPTENISATAVYQVIG